MKASPTSFGRGSGNPKWRRVRLSSFTRKIARFASSCAGCKPIRLPLLACRKKVCWKAVKKGGRDMNWIQSLYERYENCKNGVVYSSPPPRPLLPICHITTKTHIEVVID